MSFSIEEKVKDFSQNVLAQIINIKIFTILKRHF